MVIQLDFLKHKSEEDIQRDRIDMIFERSERVRKGTYAKINRLDKKLNEIMEEFESWKKTICRNG